jgi:hypothetical protein
MPDAAGTPQFEANPRGATWHPIARAAALSSRSEPAPARESKSEVPVPAKKSYKSGDKVPVGGIYKVSHAEHRVPHEVTLLAGQVFPPCARCGNQVTFQVLRRVKALNQRRERIVLHALPVLEDSSEEKLPT